ncbi:hypothetical protein K474DRAFT_1669744 [Panus rudis PR-1116 ss-1]|nr:hypothetical protein K474DRAFT_1669744 [Panus rudis PR-1116 ss-1]
MSNDIQKTDQIVHRIYTKLSLVVNHARSTAEPSPQAKVDKWFNLEIPDADAFREHTRIYRSISSLSTPPPFQLQVFLCIPELTNNQVLAYVAPDSSRSPIDPAPRYILLETYTLSFAPDQSSSSSSDLTPATFYKHGLSLFRSLFTLLRILPAWKLARRLRRTRNGNMKIELRVEGSSEATPDVLSFGTPVHNHTALPTDVHEFAPIPHFLGSLSLSVTYLTSPNFKLVDRESLLSSKFLSQDEGPEFTPTLLKNQQRDSLSTSPGSLPVRTSLPRSPPQSIADRFIVPPTHTHTRTTSISGTGASPRMQNVALPMTRAPSVTGTAPVTAASHLSDASSSRQGGNASVGSRDDRLPVSDLAARLRRESLGMGRGSADSSTSPSPVPIRRPQVNPFKTSPLSSGPPSFHSSSPSHRHNSSYSSGGVGGPSLPSRPPHSPILPKAGGPPSPIGVGVGGKLPSPGAPFRPSPPLGPSSLGDRRSLASAEGMAVPSTSGGGVSSTEPSPKPAGSGKRYSSSFGHRYGATGGAGSEGSAGSGLKDADRPSSASFLSTNTDDDEISVFVQDIDARKPLSSLREQRTEEVLSRLPPSTDPSSSSRAESSSAARPTSLRQRTMSVPGPMLTTAAAVDERLKEMNDTFLASLQGLGSRRRQREGSTRTDSTGSSTARASSGGETIGRRTMTLVDSPSGTTSTSSRQGTGMGSGMGTPPSLSRRSSATGGAGVGMYGYVRPRFGSTGSARSGMSIGSEEVIGRMDPEVDENTSGGGIERRGSRFRGY